MRRAVITGIGLVTPLGCGVEPTWARMLEGKSGACAIDRFDASNLPARIAAQVPNTNRWNDGHGGEFDPDQWVEPKEQRRVDTFIIYALAAAKQALTDADWFPTEEEELDRTGVYVGSGIGGLPGIETTSVLLHEKGPRKVSPFFIPGHLVNLASGQISIAHGFRGPNHANATACSTGAHAIGDAARMIMLDDADVMIAGGAESAISPLGVAGFAASRALSTHFNDTPEKASRPYDADRDGFVMGEGSGVVVIEELEHAKARGAKIYGEIVGYGMSGDAYHITSPPDDGNGGFRSMKVALSRAKLDPSEIDYVNAHGTSTPKGDEIELGAVTRLFGSAAEGLAMSSTKSSIGHLLGAAGAVETIFCLLAMRDQVLPPTINLDNPSVDSPINLVPHEPQKKAVKSILSNSFGFGGTNVSLVFKAFDQ